MMTKPILFLAALLMMSCATSQAIDLSSLMVTSMKSDKTDASDEDLTMEIESSEDSDEQDEAEDESPSHNS